MPDIFISYSRRDKAFVQKLNEALAKNQRDVWVDWDDIPAASDWQAEINQGITESHTFIFVISPDSVNSPYCGEEAQYAADNNKRFIPILYRDLGAEDQAKMHPKVSTHNWIMMRDDKEDFDAKMQDLFTTIDTDLDYVATHRKLLVNAREWDTKGRDPSYLLKGAELLEASNWLQAASIKEPKPTVLHSAYILSSRDAERQRQRRLLGAAAVAVAVSIALAIFAALQAVRAEDQRQIAVTAQSNAEQQQSIAENQRQIAVTAQSNAEQQSAFAQTQQAIAEDQRQIAVAAQDQAETERARAEYEADQARSLAMGVYAENFVESDQVTALALAMQASAIDSPPLAVLGALSSAAYPPGPRAMFIPPNDQFIQAINWDGTQALTMTVQGLDLTVWDIATNTAVQHFTGHTAGINGAAFSPDGSLVVSSDQSGAVLVWDVQSAEVRQQLSGFGPMFYATLQFTNDGGEILGYSWSENLAIIWNAATGAEMLRLTDIFPGRVAISGDGLVAATAQDATVTLWDVAANEAYLTIDDFAESVSTLALDAEGDLLAVASPRGIEMRTTEDGSPSEGFVSPNLNVSPYSLLFSPDSYLLVGLFSSGAIDLWTAEEGALDSLLRGQQGTPLAYSMSLDGSTLSSVTTTNTAIIWDTRWRDETWSLDTEENYGMTFTPSGQHLVLERADNVLLLSPESGDIEQTIGSTGDPIGKARYTPDEKQLVTISLNGVVTVRDAVTLASLRSFPLDFGGNAAMIISPDAAHILIVEEAQHISLWDVSSGQKSWSYNDLPTTIAYGLNGPNVAFTGDGSRFAVVTDDFGVTLFDAQAGTVLWTQANQLQPYSLQFSPDNQYLLLGNNSGGVELHLASDFSLIKTFVGLSQWVGSAAFSQDGTRIAAADIDGKIRVWDVQSGETLYDYDALLRYISFLAFSPDGQRLASISSDGILIMWRMDTLEVLRAWTAANRYVRPLSCEERIRFGLPLVDECVVVS